MSTMRQILRDLPVLRGSPPAFNLQEAQADPSDLFVEWLTGAITADVPEPHAMTLSTTDESGAPDARILILKDIDSEGLYFATSGNSRKGQQLDAAPDAALTFYWPMLARQVRIRGTVHAAPGDAVRSDFLARSASAKAIAIMGRQSQVVSDPGDIDTELRDAAAHLDKHPNTVPANWRLYVLAPKDFEFFQASGDRLHLRLRYDLSEQGWTKSRLWP